MAYRVAFETIGCRLNQAETAILHRRFLEKGYQIVNKVDSADLCVINTCSLTSQAAAKCRRKIRSIIRKNPAVCVAAVGCYAQTDIEALKSMEGIDYIVGTADKLLLAEIIPFPAKLPRAEIVRTKTSRRRFTIPGASYYPLRTRANVKIQDGCDFVCSFCIVPKSRGPARSRDFEDIVRESRMLAAAGHRELVLTGINLGTYSSEKRGIEELVRELSKIEGLDRIRLSSIEPTTIARELIEFMAEGGKLCPYLHVPLQSGDDRVLLRMRRKYSATQYLSFMELVLSRVPGVGLGTDVMVGFPGESEEDFDRTCSLIERLPFTNVHVFSFSARKGTAAYRMADRVPGRVTARRSAAMHELARKKKEVYYAGQKGRVLRVLFEGREGNGYYAGFSDNYVKVGVMSERNLANRIALVEVSGTVIPRPGGELIAFGQVVSLEDAEKIGGIS